MRTHSGRQPAYGSPWNSGRHVHTPLLHCVFGPHGDGLQGSAAGGGEAIGIIKNSLTVFTKSEIQLFI